MSLSQITGAARGQITDAVIDSSQVTGALLSQITSLISCYTIFPGVPVSPRLPSAPVSP